MMSRTTLFERGDQPDICFIQGADCQADLILRTRLECLATRVTGLKFHVVVMRNGPYDVGTGHRGTLSQLMLRLICGDYWGARPTASAPKGS